MRRDKKEGEKGERRYRTSHKDKIIPNNVTLPTKIPLLSFKSALSPGNVNK
jgi:hypothetical protein